MLAPVTGRRLGLWAARAAFVAAFVVVFVAAVAPPSEGPSLVPWDKANHFIAFYVLAALAGAGFPKTRPLLILAGLMAYGGAIELIQALPMVGRDAEVGDWIADGVGVAAALGPLLLAHWRAGRHD